MQLSALLEDQVSVVEPPALTTALDVLRLTLAAWPSLLDLLEPLLLPLQPANSHKLMNSHERAKSSKAKRVWRMFNAEYFMIYHMELSIYLSTQFPPDSADTNLLVWIYLGASFGPVMRISS